MLCGVYFGSGAMIRRNHWESQWRHVSLLDVMRCEPLYCLASRIASFSNAAVNTHAHATLLHTITHHLASRGSACVDARGQAAAVENARASRQ